MVTTQTNRTIHFKDWSPTGFQQHSVDGPPDHLKSGSTTSIEGGCVCSDMAGGTWSLAVDATVPDVALDTSGEAALKAAANRAETCLRASMGSDSTETSMFLALDLCQQRREVEFFAHTGESRPYRSDSMGSHQVSVPISLQAILRALATCHDHSYRLLWLKVAIDQMRARHINQLTW